MTLYRALISVFILTFLVACDSSDSDSVRYEKGYDDGYAVGYNAACEIRLTVVEGDWEDENYSNAYEDGHYDGQQDCKEGRH